MFAVSIKLGVMYIVMYVAFQGWDLGKVDIQLCPGNSANQICASEVERCLLIMRINNEISKK